jgi:hypothetical protein
MCLAAVLSQTVGAAAGVEAAASAVGILRDVEESTFDILLQILSKRRRDWQTYGQGWLVLGDSGIGPLARRAAEAWDTGMVPVW